MAIRIRVITSAALLCSLLATSIASETAKTEEKPPLISLSSAPAAPPESAEARIALRQHRPVSALNRYTFPGNVLQGVGDHVDHWIVMFCPGWNDKCQGLLPSYELLGVQWENKQNNELVMSSFVRFAKVDCATEKALCVSLDIDDYPSVVHYRNNQRVNSWHGGAPGLVRFVKQELEGPKKRRVRPVPKAKPPSTCSSDDAPDMKKSSEGSHHQLNRLLRLLHFAASPWRSLCFALILLAATRGTWAVIQGARTGRSIHDLLPSKRVPTQTIAFGSPFGGCRRRVVPSQQYCATSTSLQACLPQDWARERQPLRQPIEL